MPKSVHQPKSTERFTSVLYELGRGEIEKKAERKRKNAWKLLSAAETADGTLLTDELKKVAGKQTYNYAWAKGTDIKKLFPALNAHGFWISEFLDTQELGYVELSW